jgi:hypothetical protein
VVARETRIEVDEALVLLDESARDLPV